MVTQTALLNSVGHKRKQKDMNVGKWLVRRRGPTGVGVEVIITHFIDIWKCQGTNLINKKEWIIIHLTKSQPTKLMRISKLFSIVTLNVNYLNFLTKIATWLIRIKTRSNYTLSKICLHAFRLTVKGWKSIYQDM